MNTYDDELRRELHGRADDLQAHQPLRLDDVLASARKTRNQRRLVTGLAAAAVIAVLAVPAGMVATSLGTSEKISPTTPTQTPSPIPKPTPGPNGVLQVRLTSEGAGSGAKATVPFRYDGKINLPSGIQVPVDGSFYSFARLGEGYIAIEPDRAGEPVVNFLDAEGKVVDSASTGGYDLAVSADGTVVAYSSQDGRLMTVWAGHEPVALGNDPGPVFEPAAIRGSKTCLEGGSATSGCLAYGNFQGNSEGEDPHVEVWDAHGTHQTVRTVRSISALIETGGLGDSYLALLSATDDGSCSGLVVETAGVEGPAIPWQTCDYRFLGASPDSAYVIGVEAYGDGIGHGFVSILDAQTGKAVVDFKPTDTDVFVNNAVWDGETNTVLATVWDRDHWSLLRLSPDGAVDDVLGKLASGTDRDTVPLIFAAG